MDEFLDFRMPEVLDPEADSLGRQLSRAETAEESERVLADALRGACAYGQTLWNEVFVLRRYLFSILPPADQADEADADGLVTPAAGAAATFDRGRWIEACASATSSLAGPHGDGGFGRSEAEQAAQERRFVLRANTTDQSRPRNGLTAGSRTTRTDSGGLSRAVVAALVAAAFVAGAVADPFRRRHATGVRAVRRGAELTP